MKTAMQELIENYYKLETIDEFINWFSVNEIKLLEKEKEQIIEANIAGMEFIAVHPDKYKDDSEEYYNQTYNQNK